MREGWATTTLGDVMMLERSRIEPKKIDPDAVYVGLENLESDRPTLRSFGRIGDTSSAATPFVPDDVLFGKLRPYLRKVAIAEVAGFSTTEILVMRATSRVIPQFLLYLATQPSTFRRCEEASAGTRMPRVSAKDLSAIGILLPPLAEQRRIVDVIESVDNYITALETRAETARTARSALVESAIAELMKAECVPLNSIAQVVGGVTKDSGRTNSNEVEVPYLRVANVQRARLDLSEVKKISVNAAKADALKLENGDILLNEGGDRDKLGRGWVWEGQIPRCIHQNHVFRARVFDPTFDPYFIAIITNSEIGRSWFEMMGGQSTNLASISKGTLEQFPVPCADQSIQGSILEFWNALSDTAAACDALTHDARRLRSALLSDLLSGNHEIPATYDQLLQAA